MDIANKTHSLNPNDKLTFGRIFSQPNPPTGEDDINKTEKQDQKVAKHASSINKQDSYSEEGGFLRDGEPCKQLRDEMASPREKDCPLKFFLSLNRMKKRTL